MHVWCMKISDSVVFFFSFSPFQRNISSSSLAKQKPSHCHSWITSRHRVWAFFLSPDGVSCSVWTRLSPLHCKNQSRSKNRCSSWPHDRVRVCLRECVRCMTLDFSHSSDTAHLLAWSDPIWSASWLWGQRHPSSLRFKKEKKGKKWKSKEMLMCKDCSHLHLMSTQSRIYTRTNEDPGYLDLFYAQNIWILFQT